MQKSSIKYLQTKFNNISKRSYTMISQFHPRDAEMVQHTQIIKCNTAYYQKQRNNNIKISIDAEKSFNKIQYPDKSSDETRNRRNVPQHNKGYIRQAYSQHHTKWGKTETISSKVRNETSVHSLHSYST
jgi:hypothetical protein